MIKRRGLGRGSNGMRRVMWHGRRMRRGVRRSSMAPTPPRFSPIRPGEAKNGRNQVAPKNEIEALKAKARNIEARLRSLKMRITEIEQGFTSSTFTAIVDSDKCAGCGICQDICLTGAITVQEIARVDSSRCTGCGLCVQQCPQGALSMSPVDTGFREQAGSAS